MEWGSFAFIAVVFGLLALVVFYFFEPLQQWIRTIFLGDIPVTLFQLLQMRLKGINPERMVDALTRASKAGVSIRYEDLERHYLAGGNVTAVTKALVAAQKANIPNFEFRDAAGIDLAGKDVVDAVQTWVNPKVIYTRDYIKAVANDRIEVLVKIRITVRARLDRLIGGASEETIIARVGEEVVTAIGRDTHRKALEEPGLIADFVERQTEQLTENTAFDILSIDIDDLTVGKNIGVDLDIEQAEADKKIAQANAEKERIDAVVQEQQMRVRAEAAKVKMLMSESEVPLAIAQGLKNGTISLMEYYQYKNLKADTQMRESVAQATLHPPQLNPVITTIQQPKTDRTTNNDAPPTTDKN